RQPDLFPEHAPPSSWQSVEAERQEQRLPKYPLQASNRTSPQHRMPASTLPEELPPRTVQRPAGLVLRTSIKAEGSPVRHPLEQKTCDSCRSALCGSFHEIPRHWSYPPF